MVEAAEAHLGLWVAGSNVWVVVCMGKGGGMPWGLLFSSPAFLSLLHIFPIPAVATLWGPVFSWPRHHFISSLLAQGIGGAAGIGGGGAAAGGGTYNPW